MQKPGKPSEERRLQLVDEAVEMPAGGATPVTAEQSLSDKEVLARCLKRDDFRRLWSGDTSAYESKPEWDWAFVKELGRHTRSVVQIARLAKRSPLWDEEWEKKQYRQTTILGALRDIVPEEAVTPEELARRQDETIAREFVKRYRERFLHVQRERESYGLYWDGTRWRVDVERARVTEALVEFGHKLHAQAGEEESPRERGRLHALGKRLGSISGVNGVLALCEKMSGFYVTEEQLDADENLLLVGNGVLELKTDEKAGLVCGRRRDPDPKMLITRGTDTCYFEDANQSLWQQCGKDWFPDDPKVWDYIERRLGEALRGLVGKEADFMDGGTNAGKSTLPYAAREALGDELVYIGNMRDFAPRKGGGPHSSLAQTRGRRFAFVSEGEDGGELDIGLMKTWLGATKRMRFEEKYEKSEQATLAATPFFDTNHTPKVDASDDAVVSRFRVVPWRERFYNPETEAELIENAEIHEDRHKLIDPTLKDRLAERKNKEGILAALVEGLKRSEKDQSVPAVVLEATREWLGDMDQFGLWLREHALRKKGARTPTEHALKSLNKHLRDMGESPWTQARLTRQLGRNPYYIARKRAKTGEFGIKRPWVYEGLELLGDDDGVGQLLRDNPLGR